MAAQGTVEGAVVPVSAVEGAAEILDYWFGSYMRPGYEGPEPSDEEVTKKFPMWFRKNADVDSFVRAHFADPLIPLAHSGELQGWEETPRGALALAVLLDQFSRNSYRESPKSFAQDPLALAVSKRAVEKGFDQQLPPIPASFFYFAFEHSEDLADQDRSIKLFTALVSRSAEGSAIRNAADSMLLYAHKHRDVIVKFGRYPHRNNVLGRESTPEEVEYVKVHGGF